MKKLIAWTLSSTTLIGLGASQVVKASQERVAHLPALSTARRAADHLPKVALRGTLQDLGAHDNESRLIARFARLRFFVVPADGDQLCLVARDDARAGTTGVCNTASSLSRGLWLSVDAANRHTAVAVLLPPGYSGAMVHTLGESRGARITGGAALFEGPATGFTLSGRGKTPISVTFPSGAIR